MGYAYDLKTIRKEQRELGLIDMFSIWFGAGISIAEFWAGALLTPALGIPEAITVIIIGHAIGNLLLSLVSLIGYYTGLPTMYLLRYAFGKIGSYVASFFNYLQLVGWTAIMIIVGAKASSIVTEEIYGLNGYEYWIITLGLIVTVWSITGPRLWKLLEKASMVLLLILSIWLMVLVVKGGENVLLQQGSGGLGFWVSMDLVIAMPVSWAPLAADYSRFSRDKKSALWGTYVGYFISSSLFYFIGAFTNMAYGMMDPIQLISVVGLGIPAFLIIVFSTVTTTFMDVYSGGISFKNLFPRIHGKLIVGFTGLLGTIIALVFPIERYENFLFLIGGLFVPLSVVLILDYYYEGKKGFYEHRLLRSQLNIIVWLLGTLFYFLLSASYMFGLKTNVISSISENIGFSIPTILMVTLLFYALRMLVRLK